MKSRLTRGFGFVECATLEDCENMLNKEFYIRDRNLRLTMYSTEVKTNDQRKAEQYRVFIVNLNNLTKEVLETAFQNFGEIKDCYLIQDKDTGESRGLGVVEFINKDSYTSALQTKTMTIENVTINIYPYRYRDSRQHERVDNKYVYRHGFNAGHATGYNDGYLDGYNKGYNDSQNGRHNDPNRDYIKRPYFKNVVAFE